MPDPAISTIHFELQPECQDEVSRIFPSENEILPIQRNAYIGKLILTSNEGNHALMHVLIIYHFRRTKYYYAADDNCISAWNNQI